MNKTIKEEIKEYLESVGVPGVGYQVDWGRVTDEIIKEFDQKLKEQREEIIKEIENQINWEMEVCGIEYLGKILNKLKK